MNLPRAILLAKKVFNFSSNSLVNQGHQCRLLWTIFPPLQRRHRGDVFATKNGSWCYILATSWQDHSALYRLWWQVVRTQSLHLGFPEQGRFNKNLGWLIFLFKKGTVKNHPKSKYSKRNEFYNLHKSMKQNPVAHRSSTASCLPEFIRISSLRKNGIV